MLLCKAVLGMHSKVQGPATAVWGVPSQLHRCFLARTPSGHQWQAEPSLIPLGCITQRIQGNPRSRSQVITPVSAKPGPIATLVHDQVKEVVSVLDPKYQFLIAHGVAGLLLPVLSGLVAVTIIHLVSRKAREWGDQNADQLAVTELLGLLPPALETPAVATAYIMMTVRVLRNAAWIVDTYVHTFKPKLRRTVDALVEAFCSYLSPIDQALTKLYSIAFVVFITVAFIKAKTIALEFLIQRSQQQSLQESAAGGSTKKALLGTAEDFERLLVPLDALASWLASLTGGLVIAQILGVNIAPLLAVGGASGIIVGLATQQLLTNAFMGLSLFFTRPFVAGDSVSCQGSGTTLTGVVERVTPMRTYIRTEDDIIVTVPNKTIADMVVFNRSTTIKRSRLAAANRKTEPLKIKIKLPHTASSNLKEVQATVAAVLTTAKAGSSSSSSTSDLSSSGSTRSSTPLVGSRDDVGVVSVPAAAGAAGGGGEVLLAQPGTVDVQFCKFTDAGVELLVKAVLREDPASPATQAMLLELSDRVRAAGGVLVNI